MPKSRVIAVSGRSIASKIQSGEKKPLYNYKPTVTNCPRPVAVIARAGLRIESSAGITDVARHTDR